MNYDIDGLKKLIEKFEKDYSFYKSKDYNEYNCRIDFIDPFFDILGWDINNKGCKSPLLREVLTENYILSSGRPDYSMTLNGVIKFHTEAKKPSVDINKNKDSALQTRKYGWNSRLRVSVLTNFEYLIIYDTTIPPDKLDNALNAVIKIYHYKDYIKCIDEIGELISKESVYSGKFDALVEESFSYKDFKGIQIPIDQYFLKYINKWRLNIGQCLIDSLDVTIYTIDVINDFIQQIINQILFLRICEDRGIVTFNKLKDIVNKENLKAEFKKIIKFANKKFGSNLFCESELVDYLSEDVIKSVIEDLYYPISPYDFNLMQPSVLGEIYELFLCDKLELKENKLGLTKRSYVASSDIVSTPSEIVKYMVNKSLSEKCIGKEPKEIMGYKIADIACGSGMFLVECYTWLIDYVTSWYIKNDKSKLIDLGLNIYKLPYEIKRDILSNCIWGVDIDVYATEVAKFNLLLKLLEDETEPTIRNKNSILPDLDANIQSGNSLVEYTVVNSMVNATFEDILEIKPFNWDCVINEKPFDLIIGNPPYISTEHMKGTHNEQELKLYFKIYNSAKGQYDKYFLFLEKSLNLVKEDGVVCLLVPNKFAKVKAGKNLRSILSYKNRYVREFIDFSSIQLFKNKNKTAYSSILLLEKANKDEFKYTYVNDLYDWFSNPNEHARLLNANLLGENAWVLGNNKSDFDIIDMMYSNATRLENEFEIFNGIQTSADRKPVYWFSDKEIISEDDEIYHIKKLGKIFKIEKNIIRRYFKPVSKNEKNLGSFDSFDTNKYIIFPYDMEGNIYTLKEMEDRYPNTLAYLKENYDVLLPKSFGGKRDVNSATVDTWYRFGREQALTAFNDKVKLIVGVLTKKPMYIYDTNNLILSSGGTAGYCAIASKIDSKYDLKFVQAYLSHSYCEKLFSMIGSKFEGDFHARGTNILYKFPLKKINFDDEYQRSLHDKIVENVSRILDLNRQLESVLPKAMIRVLNMEKQSLIKNNDELLLKVFAL